MFCNIHRSVTIRAISSSQWAGFHNYCTG